MSEQKAIDEKELSKLFSAAYPPASATFINDLPADWRANIVQIGCKFVYDDGTNDNKGANVSIPGGGGQATLVATYAGCCRAYFVVMKVRFSDGSEQNLANSTTVPAGECGQNLRWHVVPAATMEQGISVAARPIQLKVDNLAH
jgi:hypothetical protein